MEDRVSVDPAICGGEPTIRGSRIMLKNILGMIARGYTIDRILQAYPELTREDVVGALDYASQVIDGQLAKRWPQRWPHPRCPGPATAASPTRRSARASP
jgi:uncharacterized protein (DUF433 family)